MAPGHIRQWLTTSAFMVCGALLLAAAATATSAHQANDQSSDVSSDQHRALHHIAEHTMYHINSNTLAQNETPGIIVNDQPIVDNAITVGKVIAPQDGWAVVHTLDAEDKPIANQVIGSTQVSEGTNTNVEIKLMESFMPGDQLQVMLHIDEGTKGTLEFPSGPDIPVALDGQIVASNFTVQEEGGQSDVHQASGHQTDAMPSPSPKEAQMPNTGTSNTMVPPLLIVTGLMLIAAGVLRHVSFRPTM